jgi:nucleoside-diphosphate-sugar epimerase
MERMMQGPVLVTGAGGFIGGRVVEMLHALGVPGVRAGVRRWSTAAQVGRLPVELVACDVLDPATLQAAMAGVWAVVHCAVGDRRTTVEGTRNVLAAARAAGVSRVVHLSTIDVYGTATGRIDESAPLTPTGAEYGDSKIEAERLCAEARAAGLPVTILRPTIVYGPHSALWTVEFAERLQAGPWLLPEAETSGTCNLVYVDDLVGAVVCALRRPEPVNDAFNINGPDRPTWLAYFKALNDAMGLPPLAPASRGTSHVVANVMAPVRRTAKWVLRRYPGLVMGLYQRSPLAKRLMKQAESAIRKSPTAGEFRLYSRVVDFPTDHAAHGLGYRPLVTQAEGVALSVAWLEAHGYIRRQSAAS